MKKYLVIFGLILSIVFGHSAFGAEKQADKRTESKSAKAVRQAQVLVQTGKFADAFALLQPLEFELSGDVAFDYLLGISAVNTGKPDRATLALERVEAVAPEYGEVRLWLGIAYFQSGDMMRANKSLTGLLRQSKISAQSKSTANQYLTVIKQQEEASLAEANKAKQPSLMGAIEFGLGNDSNITTQPPSDYPSAYLISTGMNYTQVAPSGISDKFAQLNGNVEGRFPFAGAGTYGFVAFDSTNRSYKDNAMMNSHTNQVKGGVNLVSGRHTYRADISKRVYRQLGAGASQGLTSDSIQNSFTGDARFTLGDRDYLAFNLQYSTPRFAALALATQDTNQSVLGTNYTHIFPQKGSPMLYLAFNHTRDKATSELGVNVYDNDVLQFSTTTDVSRNSNAVIAYTQYSFVESADISAMWMSSWRKDSRPYARSSSLGLTYGKDEMRVAMLGINWRPANDWTVKPQLMRIQNNSNIPLYSFQKTEVSVSVKREFK